MRRFYDTERSEKEKDSTIFRESSGESVMPLPPFATLSRSTLATTGYAIKPTALKILGKYIAFKRNGKYKSRSIAYIFCLSHLLSHVSPLCIYSIS